MRIAVSILSVSLLLASAIPGAGSQGDWDDCVSEGDPDRIIRGCTRFVEDKKETENKRSNAYSSRGVAYENKGDLDRAMADQNEAIRINPKNVSALINRGILYNSIREYNRTIIDLTQVIQDNQLSNYGRTLARIYRGDAYLFEGDLDSAIADYNEAIRYSLDPNNNAVTYYLFKGDLDGAITDYNEATPHSLDPQFAAMAVTLYNRRAAAFEQKGDRDRAITDYSEAIRLDPKRADVYTSRGRLFLYAGSHAKAQADFKQASDLVPKDAYTALWLDIAERRDNIPSHLAQAARQITMMAWPAPVIRLFLGELSPAETLASAANKNPKTQQGQVCEANFYSGELALLQGAKEDARRLFQLAAGDCPHGFIERGAANAELKALGAAR